MHTKFAIAVLALTAAAAAQAASLLAPQAGDLVPAQLFTPASQHAAAIATSADMVTLSWAAHGELAAPAAHLARSREYYTTVSADDIASGIIIHTSTARAVVRIQPLEAASPRADLAIHPLSLEVSDAAGRTFAAGSGMEMLASADQLAKADLPFAPGTSAFRLHPNLGAGSFKLRGADLSGSARYLVNVVEGEGAPALTLQADAPSYLHGQQLTLSGELLAGDGSRQALGKLEGELVSPAGRHFPLAFKPGAGGRLRAQLPLDADEAWAPGLWEVHANASARLKGQDVLRTLRLAVPVALPLARLSGHAATASSTTGLDIKLGLEVAAPGRYEVRGVLYATVDGALAPVAIADTAQAFEAGDGELTLRFASALLDGASGPFELRDVQLLDQGRLALLQRQQRALALDARAVGTFKAGRVLVAPAERAKLAPSLEVGVERVANGVAVVNGQ
ncbi:MAG: DUF4785 domain-containing protein [Pseudomonadota bacterium]